MQHRFAETFDGDFRRESVIVRIVSAWIPLRYGLLGLGPLLSMALNGADEAPELQLMRAWSIEHPARLDPSGLCLLDGVIYVVSDKIDDRR